MRFKSSACILFSLRAALMLAFFALTASSLYAVAPVVGDLDGDNQTTVLDITRLVNHLNGKTLLTSTNLALADVNGDGLVDQSDLTALENLILGIPIPAAPVTLDPANGASEVGVTVRPKVIFPRPVIVASLSTPTTFTPPSREPSCRPPLSPPATENSRGCFSAQPCPTLHNLPSRWMVQAS